MKPFLVLTTLKAHLWFVLSHLEGKVSVLEN